MDVRALVLVRTPVEMLADPRPVSPLPVPLLDVAGSSPLERTLEHLRRFGLQQITVISDCLLPVAGVPDSPKGNSVSVNRDRFWRAAEAAFNDLAQDGAELILIINLGGYAEIDVEKLVQFHLDRQARVSQACWGDCLLEVFCLSASRRNDAASLFRSQLARCRIECPMFEHTGYFNPLNDARDLRQFAIDILSLRTDTRPSGRQFRPGIWMERGARLEKGARLVAPCFVGAFAKIRAHAVLTRCSSVEHHAQVDLGTIVENSTVLPYCRVGAGLDVAHSVVGGGTLANLRRDVIVEILDPKLVGYVAANAAERFLRTAMEFAAYLPKQAWQGVFGKPAPQHPDLQTALHQTSPVLGSAAGYQAPACDARAAEEFPSNLAVVRRYGHQ